MYPLATGFSGYMEIIQTSLLFQSQLQHDFIFITKRCRCVSFVSLKHPSTLAKVFIEIFFFFGWLIGCLIILVKDLATIDNRDVDSEVFMAMIV